MARATREAGGTLANADAIGTPAADRRRCPANQLPQGLVGGALLLTSGQALRPDRSEGGAAAGGHHGHHDLRSVRRVKDNAVKRRAAGRDPHKIPWSEAVHYPSLPELSKAGSIVG